MGSRSERRSPDQAPPSLSRPGSPETESPQTGSPQTLLVGVVLRPHGLQGEVRIEVLSDVADRFEPGREMHLVVASRGAAPDTTGPTRRRRERVRVASYRPVKGGALVRFEGTTDRVQAESLRGSRLEVEMSEVPAAPAGFYYHHELMGCSCFDARHGELGVVADVLEDGGGVLLQLELPPEPAAPGAATGSLLVPFVEPFLDKVDIAGRRIDLRLPPGLVELCASRS